MKHHANCSCVSMDGVEDDLLAVWPDGDQFRATPELLALLVEVFPDRWSADSCYGREITAQRLGRYLARVRGLRSVKNSRDQRGYCRRDVEALRELA